MLNYIKSEVYRNINTKGNYVFLFGCMAFVIFLNVALGMFANSQPGFPYGNTKYSFSSFYSSMGMLMIVCLPLASMICGQEFKNNTLKNSIAYGISRSKIYFGKLLMEIIICTINLVLISSAYIISGYLMLENSGIVYFNDLITAIIACIPLLLVSVVATHCLYFIIDNETSVGVTWVIIMVIIPQVVEMLGRKIDILNKIGINMPWNMVGGATYDEASKRILMSWNTSEGFIRCFIVGIIGVAIFYTIGLVRFNKREIK